MKHTRPRKPRVKHVKFVELEWYCRVCWKHSKTWMDIHGMTRDDIQEHAKKQIRCCMNRDIRVIC
jgi:hypothetical protein